ncbi:MAG: hypothetical protein ACRCZF_17160, partial [Gemmataceae bacterium]
PPHFNDVTPGLVVPAGIEEVVRACMAKNPSDRPQSARELSSRFMTALGRSAGMISSSNPLMPTAPDLPPMPVGPYPENRRTLAAMPAGLPQGSDSDPIMLAAASSNLKIPTLPETTLPPLKVNVPDRVEPLTPQPTTRLKIQTHPLAEIADTDCYPFQMEAWMPEAIALVKLRGFVHDCGGEVVETGNGMVRVRLGKQSSSASGALSWFGLGTRRPDGQLDIELRLRKLDPAKENRLTINIAFRPNHASLLTDEVWRKRCSNLFVQLRAYLMGAA